MNPGEFGVWSILGGILKPPTRPLNLFLSFGSAEICDSLTALLQRRTPCTPPLLFLLAVMVVANFLWGLHTPPCGTKLISWMYNTNICCHYPGIRLHVYTSVSMLWRWRGGRGVARLSTPHLMHVITHPPLQKSASHILLLWFLFHCTAICWGKMEEKAMLAWQCDSRLYEGLVSKCPWLLKAFGWSLCRCKTWQWSMEGPVFLLHLCAAVPSLWTDGWSTAGASKSGGVLQSVQVVGVLRYDVNAEVLDIGSVLELFCKICLAFCILALHLSVKTRGDAILVLA